MGTALTGLRFGNGNPANLKLEDCTGNKFGTTTLP
jgi:hypothetical protein